MKNKFVIILFVVLVCLLGVSAYYIYSLRLQAEQMVKLSEAVRCPQAIPCETPVVAEKKPEISRVSAGPAELGGYKVAGFLNLGKKDMFMLVANLEEYEALYCGANGKEVTGDYYLYYGAENDFTSEKKLSLGKLKFDSGQKQLFNMYLNGQTQYVSVVQYNSCNSDIYRLWLIKGDDSLAAVTFNYGEDWQGKIYNQAAASFGHFEIGDNSLKIWTYLGAQPGDEADKTYYFKLYWDRAWIQKIITNYADNITGYEYYYDFEAPTEKTTELWSFKVPTSVQVVYTKRNMTPQLQFLLDNDTMFELAVDNKITYEDWDNKPYREAVSDFKFYLYVYDSKYDWQKMFIETFAIDGKKIFND